VTGQISDCLLYRKKRYFRRTVLFRLGKLSFVAFCMIAIMMAPLSAMASAHKRAPGQIAEKTVVAAGDLNGKIAMINMDAPCATLDCCEGGAHNKFHQSDGCGQCDGACQSACYSLLAVLKKSTAKLPHPSLFISTADKNTSVMSFRPESLSPPPRA